MNQYRLKKTSPLTGLIAVLLALSILRFISTILIISHSEMPTAVVITMLVAYGIATVVFLILLLRLHRSHLIFNDSGIVYAPAFGAVRNLAYNDLQKLSMGGRSYILYTMDGKKLVTFNDFRTDNASEIVAFLKSKGVKAEI